MNKILSANENLDTPFFIKIQSFLVCLLPFSLIFSIFVSDLIVVILFFIFVTYIFKNKSFFILNSVTLNIFLLTGYI